MACIRKRRGKWVVDYRDAAGIRRWNTCQTRRAAEDVLTEKLRESRQPSRPAVDPDITVAAYAERWLTLIAATVKPRTVESHEGALRCHILPARPKFASSLKDTSRPSLRGSWHPGSHPRRSGSSTPVSARSSTPRSTMA